MENVRQVLARVKIDFDDPLKTQVIIRRVTDEGCCKIHCMTADGSWLFKPSGEPYPEACLLPVAVFDNFSDEAKRLRELYNEH